MKSYNRGPFKKHASNKITIITMKNDLLVSVRLWARDLMPRLHLIHVARIQIVSTCIPCRRLHVSSVGDKIVVTATCIHLYDIRE